jgi:hypothetical protein
MTFRPTSDEIRQFLDVWVELCDFEAAQRLIRRQGILEESVVLPIPACVRVHEWLQVLCEGEKSRSNRTSGTPLRYVPTRALPSNSRMNL